MYLDMGAKRGRVHFTWKEVVAIWALLISAGGYILRNEVELYKLRTDVSECRQQLQDMKQRGQQSTALPSNSGTAADR